MSEIHGLYPTTQLINLYLDTKSHSRQAALPLAAIHEGEFESAKPGLPAGGTGRYLAGEVPVAAKSKVQFIGTAVFREDKLVGLLDGQDTRYFLMLTGNFGSGYMGIKDPLDESGNIGLRVRQGQKPKYRTSIDEDGNVAINVELFLESEIIAENSANNFGQLDLKPILEEAFSKQIEQGCHNLIKRTQDELRSDAFGFGDKVKHLFLTEQSWEEYKWLECYPEAQVNVSVRSKIRRTGLLLKRIPTAKE
ncbi:MAG: Ger(x)C family spore germination C-terminal domain-containing protein, partial [Desulfotomaculaceae bacterium]|nr:Ger(x)C family spore germination C-terminal domain-containing protein [Desulfotomaculaceae bacterium]